MNTFTPTPTPSNATTNVTYDIPMEMATFSTAIVLRAIIMIVSFGMLFVCFALRNKQPVQSRLFVPYLFLVSKIVYSIAVIVSSIPAVWMSTYSTLNGQIGCYASLWFTNPLYIADVVAIIFMFLRFFLLRAQSNRKMVVMAGRRELVEQGANKEKRDYRGYALKVLIHPAVLAIAIILSLLSIYIVGAGDAANANGFCSDRWSQSEQTARNNHPDWPDLRDAHLARYQVILVGLIVIGVIIMLITDLVINGHYKQLFKPREFFQVTFRDDDPLIFRQELYAVLGSAILLGLIVIIFAILGNSSDTNDRKKELYVLLKIILYFFFWDIPSLIAIPGIIIFTALKWEARRKKKGDPFASIAESDMEEGKKEEVGRMKWKNLDVRDFDSSIAMIHRLLGTGDNESHRLFLEFTKKEFSIEVRCKIFRIYI
jgi:hypothetical protein